MTTEPTVLNFEDAVNRYHEHLLHEDGQGAILDQPSRTSSYVQKGGQWFLFNIRGLMAVVLLRRCSR